MSLIKTGSSNGRNYAWMVFLRAETEGEMDYVRMLFGSYCERIAYACGACHDGINCNVPWRDVSSN